MKKSGDNSRPEGYVELCLDIATVCTNYPLRRQAVILREKVGGDEDGMYVAYAGHVSYDVLFDKNAGPPLSMQLCVTSFYGKALHEARNWCGWDWDPHPNKPKDMP